MDDSAIVRRAVRPLTFDEMNALLDWADNAEQSGVHVSAEDVLWMSGQILLERG